jgi:hypothetical protein
MSTVKDNRDGRHWNRYSNPNMFDRQNIFMVQSKKEHLHIALNGVLVQAEISIPPQAHAMVLFAHGSGSSRLSPRNLQVAAFLNTRGIATLLFNLLTEEEDRNTSIISIPICLPSASWQ